MTDTSQTVLFHPQTSAPCGQCRIFLLHDPAMAVPSSMERPQSVLYQNGRCVGPVLPRGLGNKPSKVRWKLSDPFSSFSEVHLLSGCVCLHARTLEPKLGISRACFPMLKREQTELLENTSWAKVSHRWRLDNKRLGLGIPQVRVRNDGCSPPTLTQPRELWQVGVIHSKD